MMMIDGQGLWSTRGNWRAQELAHLDIYGEYDRLLECLQVRYVDWIANGEGEGDGDVDDDAGNVAQATIDAAGSRRGSTYHWRFRRDCSGKFRQLPTLGTSYECEIAWLDGRHYRSGDMEDGVTSDVPCFPYLLMTSVLLSISAQYICRRNGFLPAPEMRQVEVEFPWAPDTPKCCPERS